jgi:MoaA/NifB/PqqE/SkfB family radical SAM enzyme
MRRDFPSICTIFGKKGVQQSLLTNGLLLQKRFHEIQNFLGEIITSVDGPNAETHNAIRGIDCFDQIMKGIHTVLSSNPRPTVSIRTVIQRQNFRLLGEMAVLARSLGVDHLSFLAADVSSQAFHRSSEHAVSDANSILLTQEETREFRTVVEEFIHSHKADIKTGFVAETPEKLFHLVQYFEAFAGLAPFPKNHCNAPMMSTVITSSGDLHPCFFLPRFGNIRDGSLRQSLQSEQIRSTRREVKRYSLQRCHECVCTLNISPFNALLDRF